MSSPQNTQSKRWPPTPRFSPEQFDALRTLMRLSAHGQSGEAARLVLVDGLSRREAAEKLGMQYNTVRTGVARYLRTAQIAKKVVT